MQLYNLQTIAACYFLFFAIRVIFKKCQYVYILFFFLSPSFFYLFFLSRFRLVLEFLL